MHPTTSCEPAETQTAGLCHQAQREAQARTPRRARRTPARRNDDAVQRQALFASPLQRSDAPGADAVAEAIKVTVRQFGTGGCTGRMAQEFGDYPEAAAERMRWVRSLLS